LLPAAVLGHYSDVVDWKSYVTATGSEHVDDILKFTAGNEYSQQITSSIVRDVHGISQVVWRSKEVCKSASTLVDKNIAALEQQLAIAREAKENINNVGAKQLVQMEKLWLQCGPSCCGRLQRACHYSFVQQGCMDASPYALGRYSKSPQDSHYGKRQEAWKAGRTLA
jgi:hypothetical protein